MASTGREPTRRSRSRPSTRSRRRIERAMDAGCAAARRPTRGGGAVLERAARLRDARAVRPGADRRRPGAHGAVADAGAPPPGPGASCPASLPGSIIVGTVARLLASLDRRADLASVAPPADPLVVTTPLEARCSRSHSSLVQSAAGGCCMFPDMPHTQVGLYRRLVMGGQRRGPREGGRSRSLL